jgi:hypothetical protein
MRKTIGIIFSLLLVLSPLLIAAEKDDEKPKLTFELGGLVNTYDGYLGKVGKYLPMNEGIRPVTSVQVQGMSGSTFYNLDANYRGDIWDQGHKFDIDFGRILEFKLDYTSLMHRLGHDTLFNLDTASLARSGDPPDLLRRFLRRRQEPAPFRPVPGPDPEQVLHVSRGGQDPVHQQQQYRL